MNSLHRRLVLGAIVLTLALRLAAAASPSIEVPLRWAGGVPASAVRVEGLDPSNHIVGSADVVPVHSSVEIPATLNAAKYRFSADGFVPSDLSRERLRFGVVLKAFGTVVVELPSEPESPTQTAITVHVLEDRPEPRGVTRSVPAFRRGEFPFPAPPGIWNLLIDDGIHPPRIAERLRVAPGETQRVRGALAGPGVTETFAVIDAVGKPVAGAELRWSATPPSAAADLLARWTASRALRTARDGRIGIDRLPTIAHSWTVRAVGFRTRSVEVRPRDPAAPQGQSPGAVYVELRRLPSLRIRLKTRAPDSSAARLTLWRIPSRTEAGPPNDHPVWRGEIVSEAVVPSLAGGFYRAEAALPGLVAAAERTVDESDAGSDVQDLTIDVVRKTVSGRVTRLDAAMADVLVDAVPGDAAVTANTTRLGRTRTGPDGTFTLAFSYRGLVSITASTETASKSKNVDLVGEDTVRADFEFRPAKVLLHAADRLSGDALPAAEIATEFVPLGSFSEGIRAGTTDFAGDLRFDDLSEGLLKVTARAQGYATRVLRDLPVAPEGETAVAVELTPRAPFRIRVADEISAPVPGAEILVQRDPHVRKPRLTPLKVLGRTDDVGELVLDELPGEQMPAYAVAPGRTVQAFWLPASADPEGDAERNTADVVLTLHRSSPGIRVVGSGGAAREDALLVFRKDGIEVPFSVIGRAAEANGLRPEVLFQRGDRAIHYHELLAPGGYTVEALSPRPDAANDPARDVRDALGNVTLPPAATIDLLWKEDRPYPPAVPR